MLDIFMFMCWVLENFVICGGFCIIVGGFVPAIIFVISFVFSSSMVFCIAWNMMVNPDITVLNLSEFCCIAASSLACFLFYLRSNASISSSFIFMQF